MISFRQKGDFSKTTNFLKKMKANAYLRLLDEYGRKGVAALASATPVDTGLTASSWYYTIERTATDVALVFHNSNIQNGVPIAIILQYGHGTGTGGWVQGRDYINPAVQPIFDRLANDAWREVTKL
jgi:hypothetical protein